MKVRQTDIKKRSISVRTKLGLIGMFSLLPALLIIILSTHSIRTSNEQILMSEMARMGDAVASRMGLLIRSTARMLETIAASDAVTNGDITRTERYLQNLISQKSEYATILLTNNEKRVIAAGIPISNYSLADRAYLSTAISRGHFTLGGYTISRSTGIPILPMALPLFDEEGVCTGTLIASQRIDSIAAALQPINLLEGDVLEIIDSAGIRIFRHPSTPNDQPGLYVPAEYYAYAHNKISRQQKPAIQKRDVHFIVSRPVSFEDSEQTGLSIVLSRRKPSFFSTPVAPLLLYLSLSIIALGTSLFLTAIMYRRNIGLKLTRLAKEAARLGTWNHSEAHVRQKDEDELDLIARSLRQSEIAIHVRDREKAEAARHLQESLREKETLLKEIHHRVKNNFQVISSLLSLQALSITDNTILRMFDESRNRIQSMALIHEQLYRSDNYAWIDFTEYAHSLAHQIALSFMDRGSEIRVCVKGEACLLALDSAVPLALALNELVTNSFKHGYGEHDEGDILIELSTREDGQAQMIVRDTGKGLPGGFAVGTHANLGLELVNTLVSQLKGSLDVLSPAPGSDRGSLFQLSFPLDSPTPPASCGNQDARRPLRLETLSPKGTLPQ